MCSKDMLSIEFIHFPFGMQKQYTCIDRKMCNNIEYGYLHTFVSTRIGIYTATTALISHTYYLRDSSQNTKLQIELLKEMTAAAWIPSESRNSVKCIVTKMRKTIVVFVLSNYDFMVFFFYLGTFFTILNSIIFSSE